ncbi:MAG: class I SAM-dependent rRNA methyltransferase, partial [Anaerolineae bacterium]
MITIQVPPALKTSLDRGHPWVYRDQIRGAPDVASGSWVRVHCGSFSAFGLWDGDSPIAIRLFSRREVPNADWVAGRVAEAWDVRAPVRSGATTAYRWIYGESDGLPGIVVDLYGEFAVVRSYTLSVAGVVPWVADALHAHQQLQGILWRQPGGDPEPHWGRPPPRELVVEEHGLLFEADLLAGQKTGLYFDQRENRKLLAGWCQGRTVLDCFCYTGAFSLYAARAGAASITACDGATAAIEAAQRTFALNHLNREQQTFLVEEC